MSQNEVGCVLRGEGVAFHTLHRKEWEVGEIGYSFPHASPKTGLRAVGDPAYELYFMGRRQHHDLWRLANGPEAPNAPSHV